MKIDLGVSKLLGSIGSSLQKEYKTEGGRANMQLVAFLVIIFILSIATQIPEAIINFILKFANRETIEFVPVWVPPFAFASIIIVGVWCVSRIAKIPLAAEEPQTTTAVASEQTELDS